MATKDSFPLVRLALPTKASRFQSLHRGSGASSIFGQPAGGASGRDHRRGSLHRQDGEGARATDEQEGAGGEIQEVRGLGRRQRAQEKLSRRT